MKGFLLLISTMICIASSDSSWSDGISVVQYNAEFNRENSVKNLQRVSDARIFNAWIDKHPELKEKGAIRSVPTIVIYNDGEEVRRWEAGIMMELNITYHDIQDVIDEITGANKF